MRNIILQSSLSLRENTLNVNGILLRFSGDFLRSFLFLQSKAMLTLRISKLLEIYVSDAPTIDVFFFEVNLIRVSFNSENMARLSIREMIVQSVRFLRRLLPRRSLKVVVDRRLIDILLKYIIFV